MAPDAFAQACCAGTGAVTPARLGPHDDVLLGATARTSALFGSFSPSSAYIPSPSTASEVDLEQDVFAGVRVLRRGQVSALIPLVETYRRSGSYGEVGGGVGDVNLGARYDVIRTRESRYVPGIGVLAGVTLPTGRPPDAAHNVLATDATGLGCVQANVGLALEQVEGPWLFGLTGLLALRTARSFQGVSSELAPQFTALALAAYAFQNESSTGVSLSYSVEGDATVNNATVPSSGRRLLQIAAAETWPLTDHLQLLGSLTATPPFPSVNQNQLATAGLTLGAKVTWP